MRADHVLAHVLGVRARVADPLDPLDGVDRGQQLGEGCLVLRQVATVGVDVLAEQRDLSHAVGGESPGLGHELCDGRLTSRPRVDGTMQ